MAAEVYHKQGVFFMADVHSLNPPADAATAALTVLLSALSGGKDDPTDLVLSGDFSTLAGCLAGRVDRAALRTLTRPRRLAHAATTLEVQVSDLWRVLDAARRPEGDHALDDDALTAPGVRLIALDVAAAALDVALAVAPDDGAAAGVLSALAALDLSRSQAGRAVHGG